MDTPLNNTYKHPGQIGPTLGEMLNFYILVEFQIESSEYHHLQKWHMCFTCEILKTQVLLLCKIHVPNYSAILIYIR